MAFNGHLIAKSYDVAVIALRCPKSKQKSNLAIVCRSPQVQTRCLPISLVLEEQALFMVRQDLEVRALIGG